jgi:hypothetical protein
MKIIFKYAFILFCLLAGLILFPTNGHTQEGELSNQTIFGLKIKSGGRYDNVRMCVATPAGYKGGPAADIGFYTEIGLTDKMSISFDLPVFRPILFGIAFKMLQFEPDVSLLYRIFIGDRIDLIAGPTLGLSLHYGPDYNSSNSGNNRGNSFFAMGPRLGTFFGLDFKRPNKTMNFQLGIQPYVTPLFGINDPASHKGLVAGASLVGVFRFSKKGSK